MTISVLQWVQSSTAAAGATISVPITISAGSYLDVFVVNGSTAVSLSSVSDGMNSYSSPFPSVIDSVNNWRLSRVYSLSSPSAGTYTVTATFSGSATHSGIVVAEVAGSSGPLTGAGQVQASAGTATDGISSGLMVLSAAPALILGCTAQTNSAGAVTSAGTNYVDGGGIWSALNTNFGRVESQRVTTTASIAATFTETTTAACMTIGTAWQESSSSQPLMGQILT